MQANLEIKKYLEENGITQIFISRKTGIEGFVMYPRWTHWRDLKGICPICGEPAHVGTSKRTGRHFWLHDKYDMYEYYNGHGIHGL